MLDTTRRSILFDDDGGGAPQIIIVVTGDGFRALREAIREYRWRAEICSPYDCTGQCFQQTAEILKVAKTVTGVSAVLLVTSYYDI